LEKLGEEMRQDPTIEETVDDALARLRAHFEVCPDCQAWWKWIWEVTEPKKELQA
jgi:hypothetical protein